MVSDNDRVNCGGPEVSERPVSVAVLRQESKRYVKGVDELLAATGGCTATIYQFACGSVAYFAPDAPDFAEAAELTGEYIAAAQRVLDARGVSGGNAR